MNLSKSELLFYLVGTSIIATFSLLFYNDISKRVAAGSNEEVGKIIYSREKVQRKYSAQVVWEDIMQDTPVFNHDSIRTAELSETVIKLKDKTEITLAENSLILLSFSKDEIAIDFKHGSAKAKRDGIKEGDKRQLVIKSKDTTVALGKSDISLSQEKGKELNLTVNKGKATITTKKGEKELKKDQKLVIAKGEEKVYTLNLKLTSPAPNKNIISSSTTKSVGFSWLPVKGDYNVFLEVSRNFSFGSINNKVKVTGNSSAIPLQHGLYYWRLRAINKKTKKVAFSEARRLEIVGDKPVQLITPRNGALITYKKKPPIINFKWGSGSVASGYKLTLASDKSMGKVVRSIQLPGNSISIDKLAKGTYFWKVVRTINLGGKPHNTSSIIYKLVIDEKRKLDPPALIYPPNNKAINKLVLKRKNISFTWRKGPEIPASKFILARDAGFSSIVYSATSRVNFIKLNKQLGKGSYFWKVIGTSGTGKSASPDGEINVPSSVRKFKIIESTTVKLVQPPNNALIGPRGEETYPSVTFAWKRTEVSGNFTIQMSKDKSFSSIYRKSTINGFSKTFANIQPGRYYWKVKMTEPGGALLMDSKPFSIQVKDKLRRPVADSPSNNETIDMKDLDALELSWRRLNGANLYRIRLFQIINNDYKRITALDTRNTKYKIDDLRKLDVGNFYWTLQAFETYPGSMKVIRKSPVIRINFKIKLGDFQKKPKVVVPKTIFIE